ncbi:hypothetical protein FGG08_006207 [Glutinoglossum americanum]|uniref:GDP-mannose transporter n=1 Tax=Glutinoglossum americanum TaxID=1670608 RepID=A0A9P8I1P3_9PEZI|nr:hypothetical protein FGG08_006207 [Glutinoglossum americanum]
MDGVLILSRKVVFGSFTGGSFLVWADETVAPERRRTPVASSGQFQTSLSLDDHAVSVADNSIRNQLEEGGVSAVTRIYPRPSKDQVITIFCVFLNTVSTVGLVFLNKIILSDPQLRKMQVSFAMWHFTCTAAVLWIASHRPFDLFQPVRLPVVKMMPLCIFFAGFLILNNLSLTSNSVGFYQLAKIMTTPCVALFSYLLFRKTITLEAAISLVSLCFGVALTNHDAAGTNPLGAVIAVAAFTTTAMYQIWISKKIKDFSFNVTSHLKTVIILTLGWIADGRVLSVQDLTGIIFAVGGAMVYSMLS